MEVAIIILLVGILAACTFLREEHLANAPVRKVWFKYNKDYEHDIVHNLRVMTRCTTSADYGFGSYDITVPWTYLSSPKDYKITLDFGSVVGGGMQCTISAFPAEGGITSAKTMGDCNRLIEDVMLCISSCCKDE